MTGQIQLDTALAVGVPRHRIVEFSDQAAAALAVLSGEVDASVSTAPGNPAYVARLHNAPLTSVVDSRANERGGLPLGAFSFDHESHELADAFDVQLRRTLGTTEHLAMMARYGFAEPSLRPVIDIATG